MNGYKLTIKNGEETIAFSTAEGEYRGSVPITGAEFKMNTLNDETVNRPDEVRVELKIYGNITEQDREETLKLTKWSMDANRKTLYRDVELTVYSNQNCTGDTLRVYQFSSMFVIDYQESFTKLRGEDKSSQDGDMGTFLLFIAQKAGSEEKHVYAD